MYNRIDRCDTILAFLALFRKDSEKIEVIALVTGSNRGCYALGSNEKVVTCSLGIHSKYNRQFRARIARKECGDFNNAGIKRIFFIIITSKSY